MTIQFPESACCPILDVESFPREEYRSGKCFTDRATAEWVWSRSSFFVLDNAHETLMKCVKETDSANNSLYTCTGNIQDIFLKEQLVWFTLGYRCNSKKGKSLQGFSYHFKWTQLSNTTQCEPMKFDLVGGSLGCKKYFQYTTFPNFYGSQSQDDVLTPLSGFLGAHSNPSDISCHKDYEYIICQAFFPHCPVSGMFQGDTKYNLDQHYSTKFTSILLRDCVRF